MKVINKRWKDCDKLKDFWLLREIAEISKNSEKLSGENLHSYGSYFIVTKVDIYCFYVYIIQQGSGRLLRYSIPRELDILDMGNFL